jgi:hypothetical protein
MVTHRRHQLYLCDKMNKIYSILFDIFAASLFMLSMWLMGRTDEKWIGVILFGAAMVLLYKGDSLWTTKPQPKNKTKKQL